MGYYKKTDILHKSKLYVGWNDIAQPDKKIIELCKKHNVPNLIVEHGKIAVSDYQKGRVNTITQHSQKELIADNIAVWGEASREILLESGVDDSKIHVIGSPVIWDHIYTYKLNDELLNVPFYLGPKNIDPETGDVWELQHCQSSIPQNEKRSVVAFFCHHDYTDLGVENNRLIYEEIKDRPDLFVKGTASYANNRPENPFKELFDMKVEDRATKCIFIDHRAKNNLPFIKELLKRCKCVVSTIPGTINGICWAMNVPVINVDFDWGVRDLDGNRRIEWDDADYLCELKNLNKTIDFICENDHKTELRSLYADRYMGTSAGNSLKNMLELIDKLSH